MPHLRQTRCVKLFAVCPQSTFEFDFVFDSQPSREVWERAVLSARNCAEQLVTSVLDAERFHIFFVVVSVPVTLVSFRGTDILVKRSIKSRAQLSDKNAGAVNCAGRVVAVCLL